MIDQPNPPSCSPADCAACNAERVHDCTGNWVMNIHKHQPPIVEGNFHVEVVVCDEHVPLQLDLEDSGRGHWVDHTHQVGLHTVCSVVTRHIHQLRVMGGGEEGGREGGRE